MLANIVALDLPRSVSWSTMWWFFLYLLRALDLAVVALGLLFRFCLQSWRFWLLDVLLHDLPTISWVSWETHLSCIGTVVLNLLRVLLDLPGLLETQGVSISLEIWWFLIYQDSGSWSTCCFVFLFVALDLSFSALDLSALLFGLLVAACKDLFLCVYVSVSFFPSEECMFGLVLSFSVYLSVSCVSCV